MMPIQDIADRLIPQIQRLVLYSGNRDTRAEVAALEALLDSLMDKKLVALELAIVAMEMFLLFRQATAARRTVAYLRAALPAEPLLSQIAGYLAADQPSEADMVRAAYCFKARTYDQRYQSSHHELCQALDRVVPRLRLAEAGRIADLGCGTGLVGRHLRSHGFTGELIGVDLSREMLDQAREQGGYDRLVCDDLVHALAVETGACDGITAMQVVAMLDAAGFEDFVAGARSRLAARGTLLFNAPILETPDDVPTGVVRLSSGIIAAMLRRHRLSFRTLDHADRRYYTCVVR